MSEEQKKQEQKFPCEVIDLPSEGRLYPKDSPLASGKVDIKYMTAREEDILTSANLIKKGVVIDKLLQSLILTPNVNLDDMVLGDKNAIMVASRILAYGPEYEAEITHPNTGEEKSVTFNLADCPFKKLPEGITENSFTFELPVSKSTLVFKMLTGKDERAIDSELKSINKLGNPVSPELTTRLRHTIISVDGDTTPGKINSFVNNMLARDSMALRKEIQRVSPDIDLKQEIEIGGDTVKVDIPLAVGFFWPST